MAQLTNSSLACERQPGAILPTFGRSSSKATELGSKSLTLHLPNKGWQVQLL